MDVTNIIGREKGSRFSFRFTDDDKRGSEDTITRFLETITPNVGKVFAREKSSDILYVCLELLTNTCDHVSGAVKTASMTLFFMEKRILIQYSDCGEFFANEEVKKGLESKIPIESTRMNKGGVGTRMLVDHASELHVDTREKVLSLLFE